MGFEKDLEGFVEWLSLQERKECAWCGEKVYEFFYPSHFVNCTFQHPTSPKMLKDFKELMGNCRKTHLQYIG